MFYQLQSNGCGNTFHFSPKLITSAIHTLDNKTPGVFQLNLLHYKWGSDFYASTLSNLFNLFIEYDYLPISLKLNVNVALPKYDHLAKTSVKQNPSKYRYIGLQTSVFKIFDWVVNSQLDAWQSQNNIIHASQGGFQRQRGTTEQLFCLQHAFNYNRHLYLAFLDLRKAYDSVWIPGLIARLENYQAPEALLHLLKLSLCNTQCINRIDTSYGTTYTRSNGLPQGAISSPLLFNLYINELITELQHKAFCI